MQQRSKDEQSFFFKFTDIVDSMFLFSICVVIVGLLETSVAFLFFTWSRDVFHEHPTPQTQTPSDSTLLNRIKLFSLSRQLWKNNEFGAPSTNDSCAGPANTNAYVSCNEQDCLKTCPMVTRAVSFTDGCLETEQLDEFPNVLTNSSGGIIGGSCSGGLVVFLIVLYVLYKVFKPDNRVADDPYCSRCGRIRRHGDGGINAANVATVLEECTCILA